MTQDRPERLLTTAEAARVIGVSRSTLASYARKGLLRPAFRLPTGQLRWRLSDMERQLAEIEVQDWPGTGGDTPPAADDT